MKKRKAGRDFKKEEPLAKVPELQEGYTFSLPLDKRATVVCIDEKIYNLVPTGQTLKDLIREKDFKKVPHCRLLNPIPLLTHAEQELKNKEAESFHNICSKMESLGGSSGKVTSTKKAIAMGVNIPDEIKKLLQAKEEANKQGDSEAAKKIRVQLRKLDYKRYIQD